MLLKSDICTLCWTISDKAGSLLLLRSSEDFTNVEKLYERGVYEYLVGLNCSAEIKPNYCYICWVTISSHLFDAVCASMVWLFRFCSRTWSIGLSMFTYWYLEDEEFVWASYYSCWFTCCWGQRDLGSIQRIWASYISYYCWRQ